MKRLLAFFIGLCLVFTAAFFVATHVFHMDDAWFEQKLETLRASPHGSSLGALAIVGLLAGDLLLPIPSSVVMALSGKFYGPLPGALVALAGSMLCVTIGFGVCRAGWHGRMEALLGKKDLARINGWLDRYGVALILASRPVPMLPELLSCAAGLSDLRLRTFLLASAAGHFPVCLLYAYIGSRGSLTNPWPVLLAVIGVPGLLWLIFRRVHG